MKLWQKILLSVLAISLVFVNIGVYIVFEITYQENIKSEKTKGTAMFQLLQKTMNNNITTMEKNGNPDDSSLQRMLRLYEADLQSQKIQLSLWKADRLIYGRDKEMPEIAALGTSVIAVSGKRGNKMFKGVGKFTDIEPGYVFAMQYPLTELNSAWTRLHRIYLLISVGISVILVCVLYFLLIILLKPLEGLSKQVKTIKEGNYKTRLILKGNDELTVLGRDINEMADVIEQQVVSLKKENEKKQQFINDLSHELKSPLTSIYGYAEYISKAKLDIEEVSELCKIIMEESRRLEDMSHQLLALSELKEVAPKMETFSVKKFCEELERTITHREAVKYFGHCNPSRERDKGIEKKRKKQWSDTPIVIRTACDIVEEEQSSMETANLTLYGNKELLELLLLNLVSNAIRACKMKEKLFAVKEVPGVTIEIWKNRLIVKDDGVGMEEKELERIMEPFYRVDKGRSRRDGGNGLGLTLCRQIVLCHEGELGITSEPGIGTTVTVDLWKEK